MDGEEERQDLKLELLEAVWQYRSPDAPVDKPKLLQHILDTLFANDMAPLYEHIAGELGLAVDQARLGAMRASIAARVAKFEADAKDAEENAGESEVREALLGKAEYLAMVGDKDAAFAAFAVTEGKSAGSGPKMDIVFSQARLCMYYGDWHAVKDLLAKAQRLCDSGGDWERKNKLKVYQAVFAMYSRDFKLASSLFHEALATFSATELFPYSRVVFYAVITSIIAMDRVALKAKVVDAPEVLTTINQNPALQQFLDALYGCQYKQFFQAFVEVVSQIKRDPYLALHARYYMREVRVVAYTQFLESYKSVALASMAAAFNVRDEFLDHEVAELIVAGRINARIDKVAGVIETSRPGARSALYQESLKKGDVLLNRVQKLSRVIDME
uniref:26S proteasome regulatory subunit RPN7 n=1 Tax=Dunaliella tertiolecta TaxID=3047 RepID=A0A7S3VTM2_DUNTE|eukprot:CAMPEP_0202358036 /NCGR_PEP_ID=MMETSP1126-20121109/11832_1 /ASSEMBLY_ACC=CAM_ASM_000457 /TAXON_ID=3047 /ORGANISM="Dunaliella tertiolecta, Strain CCMP1320" /LENGTH=386 /DNA_ID=CAMNT_0048951053 /DNA_START=21 /DNA_END=1181 /DNA_ORIENTATION=+